MEVFGFVDIPLWVLLFGSSLFLLYRYSISPFNVWKQLGVDGPVPSPFFGNTLDIYNPKIGMRSCMKSWEIKYGRVFGVYFFRKPSLVVTDPEMLKKIFVKEFHNFKDRFFVGDGKLNNRIIRKGVFFEYGNDWQRIRRIMTPTFTSGKLKQLIQHINKTAHHLSDNLQMKVMEADDVDAKDFFGAFALDVIAGLTFGLDINSQSNFDLPFIKNAKSLMTFKNWNKLKIVLAGTFPSILPFFELFDWGFFNTENCHYFEKSIYNLISNRKEASKDGNTMDFLQLLLNAEADDDGSMLERKLTGKEIVAQCVLFIIAGYETTSSTLQFLSYELARNKSVQDKVYEEIHKIVGDVDEPTSEQLQNLKYTSAVISETLRMYPPVVLLTREADKACTLDGVPIPAKAAILIPVYNIGRDPEFFEEPDVFKPERFLENDNQTLHDICFLPFGFGPRHCIGMRLALMQIKLALVHMLREVNIYDASPKVLELNDSAGLLVAREPIKLSVQCR